MPATPQKLREIALQLLFSEDFSRESASATEALLMRQLAVTKKEVRAAMDVVRGVQNNCTCIDEALQTHAREVNVQHISSVERAILRLMGYELLVSKRLPPKVAITEGVRLSKKFATPEASRLINAVLDALFKSHSG